MDLEQVLREEIDGSVRRQTEVGPGFCGVRRFGTGVGKRQTAQSHQPFAVMRRRLGGLRRIAGQKIVDRRNARGYRMPPGDALHRRQPRECQKIRGVIHADIRIQQDVRPMPGDLFAGRLQTGLQTFDMIRIGHEFRA